MSVADGRRWLVLSLLAPPRGEEPLLVDALRRLGARQVERTGERFTAHFPPPPDLRRLLADVEVAARASTSLPEAGTTWAWQSHEAWAAAWTGSGEPRRVSRRIVIASPDHPPGEPPDAVVVRLEPAVAFGTATHPTTRACLRLLDQRVRAGDRLLDVGTGSGVLAIAAALLGAGRVLALEADPLACAAARANSRLNRTTDRVRVREVRVGPATLRRAGTFDGILANLEAGLLASLLPALAGALRPGGWLVVSGALEPERAALLAAALEAGLTAGPEDLEGAWWTASFELRGR